MMHTQRDGTQVALTDMTDAHLLNTLARIRRRAETGVLVQFGSAFVHDDEPWSDETILYGREAWAFMHGDAYAHEARRRGLQDGGTQ
jgi:hypothetical protein